MPGALLDVIGVLAALICLRGPVRAAALTLLGGLFLVPDSIHLTFGPSSLTVLRLLVWATTAGLVLRASKGVVPWSSLRPGRVHLALAGFVLVAYVVGVSWAPWPADFHSGFSQWLSMVDQLLFLTCVIAFARIQGVRWMATAVVSFAAVDAGIGVMERLTGGSYSHWWYLHARALPPSIGSVGGPLERRGAGSGSIRVRANAEFALQYAWVLVTLIPLACAVAIERSSETWHRSSAFWVAPPLMVAATVLTVSRSVFGGLAAGAVVWLICSRFDRRVLSFLVGVGLLAGAVAVGFPALRHPYHAALADSIQSRVRRQQFVATAVVNRPLTGVGLAGLLTYGITGTDSMYVLTYGTLGVIGVVGLVATFVTTLFVAADGALRSRTVIPAAIAGGLVAGIMAAGAFDSLSGPTSGWALWLLAGLAAAAYEEGRAGVRLRRLSPARLLIPTAGLAIGLLATGIGSPRSTTVSNFSTLDARDLAPNVGDPAYAGQIAVNTVCVRGKEALRSIPVTLICQDRSGAGLGYLTVSGADRATVTAALTQFDAAASGITAAYERTALTRFDGRSAPLRTAPVWMGLGGLLLALLLPRRPLRRLARGTPAVRPRALIGSAA